jgi:hypothetical protein
MKLSPYQVAIEHQKALGILVRLSATEKMALER